MDGEREVSRLKTVERCRRGELAAREGAQISHRGELRRSQGVLAWMERTFAAAKRKVRERAAAAPPEYAHRAVSALTARLAREREALERAAEVVRRGEVRERELGREVSKARRAVEIVVDRKEELSRELGLRREIHEEEEVFEVVVESFERKPGRGADAIDGGGDGFGGVALDDPRGLIEPCAVCDAGGVGRSAGIDRFGGGFAVLVGDPAVRGSSARESAAPHGESRGGGEQPRSPSTGRGELFDVRGGGGALSSHVGFTYRSRSGGACGVELVHDHSSRRLDVVLTPERPGDRGRLFAVRDELHRALLERGYAVRNVLIKGGRRGVRGRINPQGGAL